MSLRKMQPYRVMLSATYFLALLLIALAFSTLQVPPIVRHVSIVPTGLQSAVEIVVSAATIVVSLFILIFDEFKRAGYKSSYVYLGAAVVSAVVGIVMFNPHGPGEMARQAAIGYMIGFCTFTSNFLSLGLYGLIGAFTVDFNLRTSEDAMAANVGVVFIAASSYAVYELLRVIYRHRYRYHSRLEGIVAVAAKVGVLSSLTVILASWVNRGQVITSYAGLRYPLYMFIPLSFPLLAYMGTENIRIPLKIYLIPLSLTLAVSLAAHLVQPFAPSAGLVVLLASKAFPKHFKLPPTKAVEELYIPRPIDLTGERAAEDLDRLELLSEELEEED